MDQARIQSFFESTKKKNATDNHLEGDSEPVTNDPEKLIKEQEKLKKRVTSLIKKQKLKQVRGIVKGHVDLKPWGQDALVKVCDVCRHKCGSQSSLSLLFCCCNCWSVLIFVAFPGWLQVDSIVNGNSLYTTSC